MTQPSDTLASYTGKKRTINAGDELTDRRAHNRRTLRIDSLYRNKYGEVRAACTITAADGEPLAKPRTTDMCADTLTGLLFLPVTAPRPTPGQDLQNHSPAPQPVDTRSTAK